MGLALPHALYASVIPALCCNTFYTIMVPALMGCELPWAAATVPPLHVIFISSVAGDISMLHVFCFLTGGCSAVLLSLHALQSLVKGGMSMLLSTGTASWSSQINAYDVCMFTYDGSSVSETHEYGALISSFCNTQSLKVPSCRR